MGKLTTIKQLLLEKLLSIKIEEYNKKYITNRISYDTWIRQKEEQNKQLQGKKQSGVAVSVGRVPYEVQYDELQYFCKTSDILIFADKDGEISADAEELIEQFFLFHKKVILLYGDEDVKSPEAQRYNPWFKPHWSPDTFLSYFYFGSIFALRTKALEGKTKEEIGWVETDPAIDNLYRLCLFLAKQSGGFDKRDNQGFPVGHIDEILYHASYNRESTLLCQRNKATQEETINRDQTKKRITVVIPSKDNPVTLFRCIHSFEKGLTDADEVIVIDNGSDEKNQKTIEGFLQQRNFTYLYDPMPFNFSIMCNKGAERGSGEVILFLNDDVEIKEEPGNLFCKLYETAMKPYVGGVGVKLLYPESDLIQHSGICSQHLGPVHKLQFKNNNIRYYYGWNQGNRNVIAVTGALLVLERKKYMEVDGFCPQLAHSFNDVDLCFSLYEKGYYQVVIQDTKIYHHESLSRGKADAIDKNNRLYGEKELLYKRHRALSVGDPFYHKYLISDVLSTGFETAAQYEYNKLPTKQEMKYAKPLGSMPKRMREDACVIASVEFAGTMQEWIGCGEAYYVQGYVFVGGSDNARYEKTILLRKDTHIWSVPPKNLLRRDVEENLPDQKNVGMAGFCVHIKTNSLEKGSYEIGLLLKDSCTGFHLLNWTKRSLEVH